MVDRVNSGVSVFSLGSNGGEDFSLEFGPNNEDLEVELPPRPRVASVSGTEGGNTDHETGDDLYLTPFGVNEANDATLAAAIVMSTSQRQSGLVGETFHKEKRASIRL